MNAKERAENTLKRACSINTEIICRAYLDLLAKQEPFSTIEKYLHEQCLDEHEAVDMLKKQEGKVTNNLYHATNKLLNKLTAIGKINTEDSFQLIADVLDALDEIDGGVYQEGHKLVPLEPSEERFNAFKKVWFKAGWPTWCTNNTADRERFNETYKAMIGGDDNIIYKCCPIYGNSPNSVCSRGTKGCVEKHNDRG